MMAAHRIPSNESFFHRHLAHWVDREVESQSTEVVDERPRFVHAVLLLTGAVSDEGMLKVGPYTV